MSLNQIITTSVSEPQNPLSVKFSNVDCDTINDSVVPPLQYTCIINPVSLQTDGIIPKFGGGSNVISSSGIIASGGQLNVNNNAILNTQEILSTSALNDSDITVRGTVVKMLLDNVSGNNNQQFLIQSTPDRSSTSTLMAVNKDGVLQMTSGSNANPAIVNLFGNQGSGIFFGTDDVMIANNTSEVVKFGETDTQVHNNLDVGTITNLDTINGVPTTNIYKYVVPSTLYTTIQSAIDAINAEYLFNSKKYTLYLMPGVYVGDCTMKLGCLGIIGLSGDRDSCEIQGSVLCNVDQSVSLQNLRIIGSSNGVACVQVNNGSSQPIIFISNCNIIDDSSLGNMCIGNSSGSSIFVISYTTLNGTIDGQYYINSSGGYFFVTNCYMGIIGWTSNTYRRIVMAGPQHVFSMWNCIINGRMLLNNTIGGLFCTAIQDITNNHDYAPLELLGTVPFGQVYNVLNCYLSSDPTSNLFAVIGDPTFNLTYNNTTCVGRTLVQPLSVNVIAAILLS